MSLFLIGPSGVGKSSLKEKLLQDYPDIFEESISCTTRCARGDEQNGTNYYFISEDEFKEKIEYGFVVAHWDGTTETELKIKEETKATIRCIPLENPQEDGKCILTGKPSKQRVIFAKAY